MRKRDRKSLLTYSKEELDKLSFELRGEILDAVIHNGGHLSSNLGATDRTISLLRAFDPFYDDILFDVGHQTYAYKLLTGRKLYHLRKTNGLSPFSLRSESKADQYDNGHAGDSLSTAMGRTRRKNAEKRDTYTVVVIGDASLFNGRAREALEQLSRRNLKRLIIVLNDNGRSIGENKGSFAKEYLPLRKDFSDLKDSSLLLELPREENQTSLKEEKDSIFSHFSLPVIGPVSGHSFTAREDTFKEAKQKALNGPVLVHLRTIKGYGYSKARKDKEGKYHCVEKDFDKETDTCYPLSKKKKEFLLNERKKKKDIYVIAPDSIYSSGLKEVFDEFPLRCINTEIGEENAIGIASGLRLKNKKAVIDISSCFLQRGYDQIRENVSRQKLPALFFVEKAGLNGEDGESHQGLYDVARLKSIPSCKVRMPFDISSLEYIRKVYSFSSDKPLFVRIPREKDVRDRKIRGFTDLFPLDRYRKGKYAFIGVGPLGMQLAEKRKRYHRFDVFRLLDLLSEDSLFDSYNLLRYKRIFFYDPYSTKEGSASHIGSYLLRHSYKGKYYPKAFENKFVPVGQNEDLLKRNSLYPSDVLEDILDTCHRHRKKEKKK